MGMVIAMVDVDGRSISSGGGYGTIRRYLLMAVFLFVSRSTACLPPNENTTIDTPFVRKCPKSKDECRCS
jgi:hypothetical protein